MKEGMYAKVILGETSPKARRADPLRSAARPAFTALALQQTLFHFLLTSNAVLGPGYCFEPLLLHLFLAVGADAVFIGVDALQSRIDHVEDRAVRIGHAEEEFLRVGVRCLVREVHRRIFVRGSPLFLRARDGLHQLFAPHLQLLSVVIEPFLVHGSPAPLSAFGAI
jgi:hypothetical protein